MQKLSRRDFIQTFGSAGIAASLPAAAQATDFSPSSVSSLLTTLTLPLYGYWQLCFDPQKQGRQERWYTDKSADNKWQEISVPHTWQINRDTEDYMGWAWYRKTFFPHSSWSGLTIRLEFEAIYHTATVWLNGQLVGEHIGKGYTAFTFDITNIIIPDQENILIVLVDNSFNDTMLPRNNSFDWNADGGIYRPVNLLVSPQTFIERADIVAVPDLLKNTASVNIHCVVNNKNKKVIPVAVTITIVEEKTGRIVLQKNAMSDLLLQPEEQKEIDLPEHILNQPELWHFDHPHLYRLIVELTGDKTTLHQWETTFGIRRIEVKSNGFYLNGERVWLMGVERMAGSHPDYGMAEPESWIIHDHQDMNELNCVFTRVHWQQDKKVLDYCDRHGILIQVEVPTWGGDTFKGMQDEPAPEIMQNALEQLREMIKRDRNHPSIISWGLCNEIGGQNPPAYKFAKKLYEEAKKLDPNRLRSYASNSLSGQIAQDVSGLMDFIEWNEYYETWYGGTVDDMRKNLVQIHDSFPDKMIVISEYGYCECTDDRVEGDPRRIDILKKHTAIYRDYDFVGGAIFFCYNDYRTHIGDKGIGKLRQRVHGVVDVYGSRKPSFNALRAESSPVADMQMTVENQNITVSITTRKVLPAYCLKGYTCRWIVYAWQNLPMEQGEIAIPDLKPGDSIRLTAKFRQENPIRIIADIVRPTGYTVLTSEITF